MAITSLRKKKKIRDGRKWSWEDFRVRVELPAALRDGFFFLPEVDVSALDEHLHRQDSLGWGDLTDFRRRICLVLFVWMMRIKVPGKDRSGRVETSGLSRDSFCQSAPKIRRELFEEDEALLPACN